MKLYKIGKVISISKTYIILETNYTGEIIYTPRPEDFKQNTNQKIYIYEHKTDYTNNIFGFNTFEKRLFFIDLIGIPSIGPKTAISIIKENFESAMNFIANGDVKSLSKFSNLGISSAERIVSLLKRKYIKYLEKPEKRKHNIYEIQDSLKILGFNKKQIDFAIKRVKPNNNLELMVEEAIKVISNAKISTT